MYYKYNDVYLIFQGIFPIAVACFLFSALLTYTDLMTINASNHMQIFGIQRSNTDNQTLPGRVPPIEVQQEKYNIQSDIEILTYICKENHIYLIFVSLYVYYLN